ncbi:hypothetical protein Peur_056312 [Populus x canadensis]
MKVFLDEEDHENGNGCGDMVVNRGWCRISSIDNSSSFPLVSSPPSESLSLSLSLSLSPPLPPSLPPSLSLHFPI